MPLVFETPRLVLGQFTEQDAPLILQLNSDPDVVKYVHEPVLTSEEQARKIILDILFSPNIKITWAGGRPIQKIIMNSSGGADLNTSLTLGRSILVTAL